ncbi:MAG: hypothetical protein DRP80_06040 [Candidatus Omnitrophota bacterium]|nr:MAG: hypothetical protein DRP80_06040 [Candidatus Omnitrophota bacterium]
MLRKIPIAGSSLKIKDLLTALSWIKKGDLESRLYRKLSHLFFQKYFFFLNSGLSSFFVILGILRKLSFKKKVILPAYTAPSLVVAIKKVGLFPVLCDINLENFNMDREFLFNLVSGDTLCVVGVHMFGIPEDNLEGLKEKFPSIYIIEDCAQALGTKFKGNYVGNLGDISFFSFNRGKNLSTYCGGLIVTNDNILAERIDEKIKKLPRKSFENYTLFFKNLFLSLAVRPLVYGLGYKFISRFKDTRPPKDVILGSYTDFQKVLLLLLLENIDKVSKKRYLNGIRLIEALTNFEGIVLPKISKDIQPAFNRLPILFKDLKKKERVQKELWKVGIETSSMYIKPLHHIFDLGYRKEEFPNACYFAQHLLTLPTHPLMSERQLDKIIEIIRKNC